MPQIEGQVSIQADDVITRLTTELGNMTQRAVIAEAGNAVRDRSIAELTDTLGVLRSDLAAREALDTPEESSGVPDFD
jgi:hypothetical protein